MLFAGHSFVVALCIQAVLALRPRTNLAAYTNSTSTSTPHSTIAPQTTSKTCITNCNITTLLPPLMRFNPAFFFSRGTWLLIVASSTPDPITNTQVARLPNTPTLSTAASSDNIGAFNSDVASTGNGGSLAHSNTISLPIMPTPAPSTVGGQWLNSGTPGDFVIGTQNLAPGAAVTAAEIPVSLASSESFIVIGTATEKIAVASAGAFLIGSQILAPGGVVTISGIPVSQSSSPSEIVEVEGSSTSPSVLPSEAMTQPSQMPDMISFKSQIYTVNSASDFFIGGQTLTPGGVITVFVTPISLPEDGSYVIESTSTATFNTATQPPEIVTIGNKTYTMNNASDFMVGGQTLTPDRIITISGTPVSLAATPTDIVIGTSTERVGDLIMSGIGGYNGPAPTATFVSAGAHPTGKSAARVIAGIAAGVAASVVALVQYCLFCF